MAEVGKPGSGTNLRVAVYDANAEGLEAGALEGLGAIMAFMRGKAFIRDYKLEADDYDRQSWDEGYSLELQASVFEPGEFWTGFVGWGSVARSGLRDASDALSTHTALLFMKQRRWEAMPNLQRKGSSSIPTTSAVRCCLIGWFVKSLI